MDFQTWTGMTSLKSQLAPSLTDLVPYVDEGGRALNDLPDLPIDSGETASPIRFLPEYDNILIAHKDRRRILPEAYRKRSSFPREGFWAPSSLKASSARF